MHFGLAILCGLWRVLGWRLSDDPTKSHPFATELDVLGVRLNAAAPKGGSFVAGNRFSRIEKIHALLEETTSVPILDNRQAQVLPGNLNFAMFFFLGKSLMVAARAFASLTTEYHRATQ